MGNAEHMGIQSSTSTPSTSQTPPYHPENEIHGPLPRRVGRQPDRCRPTRFPRGLFGFPNVGSGNGAGFGTGSAGPGGVSSTGVAVASAQNGGAPFSTGTGTASSNPFFGFNANGQGSSNSFGK